MKPFALLFLTCAITFGAHAFDTGSNILNNQEFKRQLNDLTRQAAETKRQQLIEELFRAGSFNSMVPYCDDFYNKSMDKLLPDHGQMAERRDCIDRCNVRLMKNKCTYSTTCACVTACSAVAMFAGLGMVTASTCMYCLSCSDCVLTCDACTGTCCKLAYIGTSISTASFCAVLAGLAGFSEKVACFQQWDKDRLNRLIGSGFPQEDTPLFSEARDEIRKQTKQAMLEDA